MLHNASEVSLSPGALGRTRSNLGLRFVLAANVRDATPFAFLTHVHLSHVQRGKLSCGAGTDVS